jgi:hypothetical protein
MYFNFPYYRPRLFIENNFELLFLSILLVGSIKYSNKINFVNLLMFSFIAISSKSRSGIAIFFFIIFICYFKKEYLKIKYLWIYLLIALCLVIGIDQVIQRIPEGGIESIDRFRFFFFFLEEIKDWSFLNYLFGESIITPLSPSTCSKLSYYDQLYSFKGDGTCYSVIFHSFILRIIFDHGFLGFLFLFYIIKKVLSMSRFSIRHTIALIGVLLLNSISISSLNSIFSIFAIMIILMVKSKEKK